MNTMQEAQVAAMFAQAFHGGVSGSDSFDKALLIGTKEDGTDFHSMSAKAAGISRTNQKTVNYALTYGCGVKTATKSVAAGLKPEEKHQAKTIAKASIAGFKGTKNKNTGHYEGGIASNYFNYVYGKSDTRNPTYSIFNQRIPKVLDKAYIGKSGSPAQINAFIQAVCATNGMLSAFNIFLMAEIEKEGITDFRFAGSIHD